MYWRSSTKGRVTDKMAIAKMAYRVATHRYQIAIWQGQRRVARKKMNILFDIINGEA